MSALFFPNQPVSPDEKIFTTADERGFLPHTPHPTPCHHRKTFCRKP
ncbi:MAG: hypothetical protein PX636_14500 [Microcystis sp. M53598_WE2]|nr:hypothetical protein [Microcystis sp. M53598_WE2]